MTSHDKAGPAAAAIPCPPAWEINGPTNRRAKFSEGGRIGGTREWNGTERQGKMTTCSYKNFYLKATVRVCFRVCCCLLYLLSVCRRLPDENEVDNPNEFLITTGKTDENRGEKHNSNSNNNKMKRQQKVRT